MSSEGKDRMTYVELPGGLFTAEGLWFHTTTRDISEFAPALVDRLGIDSLLEMATDWIKLPVSVSIWALIGLLLMWPPFWALSASILVYLFLAVASPSVVLFHLISTIRKMNHPIVQGLLYVLVLSILAAQGQMGGVGVGLLGFVLFRWQLVSKILTPIVVGLSKPLSSLGVSDTVLRNVLIRGSLKYGLPMGEVDRMQKRMIEIMTYHKTRKQ